jgi:cyanate permease
MADTSLELNHAMEWIIWIAIAVGLTIAIIKVLIPALINK